MTSGTKSELVYSWVVPGKPIGKGRPKFRRIGNFVSTYTPKETVNFEGRVAYGFTELYGNDKPLLDEPLAIRIIAEFCPPKSWPKKKLAYLAEGGFFPHIIKPDGDNILKAVSDSLNGVVLRDDSLFYDAGVKKFYGSHDQVTVSIYRFSKE